MSKLNPTLLDRTDMVQEYLLDGDAVNTLGTNGTASNVTWLNASNGYVSENGSFNGTSSYVSTTSLSGVRTVNMWVKGTTGFTTAINTPYCDASADKAIYEIRYNYSGGVYGFGGVIYCAGGTVLTFTDHVITDVYDEWNMITLTADGSTGKLFFNGVEVDSGSYSIGTTGYGTYSDIGRYRDSNNTGGIRHFPGEIALTRIYDAVLSQTEIDDLYQEGLRLLGPTALIPSIDRTDLVGSWDGDFSGTTLYDTGSNGFDLTAQSAVAFHKEGLTNIWTGNGSTTSVYNSTSQALGLANDWSLCLAIKPGSDTGLQVLNELRNYATDLNNFVQIRKEATTEKLRILLYNSSGSSFKDYTSTSAITQSEWSFHVITWDGTNLKYYRDGVEDTTMTKTTDSAGTMTNSSRKITWGNDQGTTGTNEYTGDMGMMRMISSSLAQADIDKLYVEFQRKLFFPNYSLPSLKNKIEPLVTDGLVGDWCLNGHAEDIVGTNNGTATNVTYVTKGNREVAQGNGTSSKIIATSNPYTGQYATTSFWYKPVSVSGGVEYLYSSQNSVGTVHGAYFNTGSLYYTTRFTTGYSTISTTSGDTVDQWYHFCAVTGPDGLELFLDGVSVASNSTTGTLHSSTYTGLGLLSTGGGTSNSNIEMACFKVYDSALSQNEISKLYTEGDFKLNQSATGPYTVVTTDLVAEYLLNSNGDDTEGTSDGTENNMDWALAAEGEVGDFNGTSSNVALTNAIDLDQDFTISMWFNSDAIGDGNNHWLWTGRGEREVDMRFRNTTNNLECSMYNGALYDATINVSDMSSGTWHHVVFTRSKTNGLEAFLDTVSKDTNSYTGNGGTVSTGSFIGDHSTFEFDGKICLVRFYDAVKTQQDIDVLYSEGQNYLYGVGHNLEGKILEFSKAQVSGVYIDQSGNGNDGTENGTIVDSSLGLNNIMELDGTTTESIDCGSTLIPATGDFTLRAQINYDTTGWNEIFSQYSGGQSGRMIWGINSGTNDLIMSVSGGSAIVSTTLTTGTWYDVVITRTGSNYEQFINGVSDATGSKADSIYQGVNTFVGGDGVSFAGYDGKMANPMIWDRVLSDNEIQQLYYSNYIPD